MTKKETISFILEAIGFIVLIFGVVFSMFAFGY